MYILLALLLDTMLMPLHITNYLNILLYILLNYWKSYCWLFNPKLWFSTFYLSYVTMCFVDEMSGWMGILSAAKWEYMIYLNFAVLRMVVNMPVEARTTTILHAVCIHVHHATMGPIQTPTVFQLPLKWDTVSRVLVSPFSLHISRCLESTSHLSWTWIYINYP
jgi:hypothetical protein